MKMCSEVFQFEKELKWENPGPGIRRQIMGYDEQLMMVKVVTKKQTVLQTKRLNGKSTIRKPRKRA